MVVMVGGRSDWQVMPQLSKYIHMVWKEWLVKHSYPASLSQWQSDRLSSLHCDIVILWDTVTLRHSITEYLFSTMTSWYCETVTLRHSCTEHLLSTVTMWYLNALCHTVPLQYLSPLWHCDTWLHSATFQHRTTGWDSRRPKVPDWCVAPTPTPSPESEVLMTMMMMKKSMTICVGFYVWKYQ